MEFIELDWRDDTQFISARKNTFTRLLRRGSKLPAVMATQEGGGLRIQAKNLCSPLTADVGDVPVEETHELMAAFKIPEKTYFR